MTGRTLLCAVVAVVAAIGAPVTQAPASAQPAADRPGIQSQVLSDPVPPTNPPNVVILLLDDYPAMDDRILKRLPNIKETFLDQGILFDNYWGNFPLCCPGRAGLLTGQRAIHHGVRRNSALLFDPNVSLATELHAVRYRTMIFGKYLNEMRRLADKTPPGWDDLLIMGNVPYFDYYTWTNGVRRFHGSLPADYSTDVFANGSMPFIEAAPADQPLFLFLNPNATHGGPDENGVVVRKQPVAAPRHRGDERCDGIAPLKPPNYNEADVSDKPAYVRSLPLLMATNGWPLRRACESLLSVDEWFGRVVAQLKTQGRYNNTLFMLTQDNGMSWGANRFVGKIAPYTAEMSLYVAWPSVLGSPMTRNATLLSNIDIAPTLCEIAGCEMGPFANGFGVDGQSFAGLIDGASFDSVPARDSIIIENGDGGTVPSYRGLVTGQNHARGRWLFVRYGTGERELYDLAGGECWEWQVGDAGDPCMMRNAAPSRPNLRKFLAAELAAEW